MKKILTIISVFMFISCGSSGDKNSACNNYCEDACNKFASCAEADGITLNDNEVKQCDNRCLETLDKTNNENGLSDDQDDNQCSVLSDNLENTSCSQLADFLTTGGAS